MYGPPLVLSEKNENIAVSGDTVQLLFLISAGYDHTIEVLYKINPLPYLLKTVRNHSPDRELYYDTKEGM